MTELMLSLLGTALGVIAMAIFEQRRSRLSLDEAQKSLRADRDVLAQASAANETMAQELTRQRDQLASLEMRLGSAPTARGFTPR